MSGPLVSASAAFVAKNSRIPPYAIEQSLRFDGTAYLSRTPSTNGNRTTGTVSMWFKKSYIQKGLANQLSLLGFTSGSAPGLIRYRYQYDYIEHNAGVNGGSSFGMELAAEHRDPSAWMHFVWTFDYDNASTSERMRMYINGVRQATTTYNPPTASSGNTGTWNASGVLHQIGRQAPGEFQGYMAEIHNIDGTALEPTSFGEYDDNGVWSPIEVSGLTYGTNGFYLKFDPTATNGIGHDHSGNGNNFTPTNFTTSGTGTDVMSDTPTTNYCTLNPGYKVVSGATISEGNLKVAYPSAPPTGMHVGTLATTNAFYVEAKATSATSNQIYLGVETPDRGNINNNYPGGGPDGWGYGMNGNIVNNGSTVSSTGTTYTTNDLIGIACDPSSGTIEFFKNGTSVYSGTSVANVPLTICVAQTGGSGNSGTIEINCGQREFAYPPGTASATSYFNTVTYTGNGSTQSITGVGFQPDFVWIKKRGSTGNHMLTDVVRGPNTEINSNTTAAETANTNALTSFDSDGFSVGADGAVNINNESLVAWCWKAGGTPVSNTDGSITSQVSANQDAGFSIVSYTGNGVNGATWGHGLGVPPDLVIVKNRDAELNWAVYHSGVDATDPEDYWLLLDDTNARVSNTTIWGSTAPTSTTVKVGWLNETNANNTTYIAYCWAEVEGYSKFGSYTGNGSSTGPFVECGFKPRFVMLKRTDSTSDWFMYDTIRGTNNKLYAETDTAENAEDGGSTSSNTILSLSSGFQLTSGNGSNSSGGTYIFMAFAENFSADSTYKALNTANLPAPDIKDGSDYFNTVLWTGNATDNRAITGVGFQPSWTWIKTRSVSDNHNLHDEVRGANRQLFTNTTDQEFTSTTLLKSFDSDGFTLGTDSSVNGSGRTLVAWNWLASNTSGSSNTAGSITSTVSANPSAGFSIVSYTGNATSGATIGHGLGVAPSMVIVKNRDDGATHWHVYHQDVGNTQYLLLSLNYASTTASNRWNNTSPSSSVVTLGDHVTVNGLNDNIIAYCFAEVEGYSKFGSYTGNGSTDGPFLSLGFKPAWIMYKITNTTGNWIIHDTTRSEYNVTTNRLFANLNNAENTSTTVSWDLLSNGAKIRTSDAGVNGSGNTFIYAAFAEHPTGGSGVSPATAR